MLIHVSQETWLVLGCQLNLRQLISTRSISLSFEAWGWGGKAPQTDFLSTRGSLEKIVS